MIVCQHCGKPAQAYLCGSCIDELRAMLTGLPRWIEYLTDAITGQARLGTSDGPRTKSDEQPLRINLRASSLGDDVHATLVAIVRTVEDSHGLRITGPTDSAGLARWLAQHVTAIAAHEAAAEHYVDVQRIILDIEHRINRPVPPRFCGPCPAPDEDDPRRACGTALMAKRDAIEVRCPTCKTTHNVERLLQRLLADVDHWRFTVSEILMIMRALEEPLNERTFRRWRAQGKVRPRGFRRPDGAIGLTRRTEDDQPLYRLAEVRGQMRRDREMVRA